MNIFVKEVRAKEARPWNGGTPVTISIFQWNKIAVQSINKAIKSVRKQAIIAGRSHSILGKGAVMAVCKNDKEAASNPAELTH